MNQASLSALIWSVADLLWGDYKQSEYGRVILPFTVLRRLDCVLQPSKSRVLAEKARREAAELETRLNATLLIRYAKGLELTPARRSYVAAAKTILEQLTEAERAA